MLHTDSQTLEKKELKVNQFYVTHRQGCLGVQTVQGHFHKKGQITVKTAINF